MIYQNRGFCDTLHVSLFPCFSFCLLLEQIKILIRKSEQLYNVLDQLSINQNCGLNGLQLSVNILKQCLLRFINLQGKSGIAAKELVHMVKDGLPKVAIVGPFTSVSMALIGQMTPVFNLLQVYPILTLGNSFSFRSRFLIMYLKSNLYYGHFVHA